jgi:DNA-binding transcriptional LysR family regulator
MDIRQLRYFVEAANTRGFNHASARLNVSQSSISRRIQDLEQELGAKLFERSAEGARLTDVGKDFLVRAAFILGEIESARNEAQGKMKPSGSVTLGSSLTMGCLLLAELTRRIEDLYPQIKLTFVEGAQYSLMEGLDTGRIDLAVMVNPRRIRSCTVQPLCEEKLFWIRKAKSGRGSKTTQLSNLHGLPLVLFPRPSAHRDMLDRVATRDGIALNVQWEIANVETQKNFIRLGLANGIMPFSAVSTDVVNGSLKATQIEHLTLRQSLVTRNNRPAYSTAGVVATVIREIFQEMIQEGAFNGSILPFTAEGWSSD